MNDKLNYGTWIRKKKIITIGVLSLIFILLASGAIFSRLFLLSLIPACFFSYMTIMVWLNYYRFSPKGGDYQNKVHDLIIQRVTGKSQLLDIGCGNGNLAIKLARQHTEFMVTGLDYWGNDWEYAASICENNARLEKISTTQFIKGSASQLPFGNEYFDCVVSCLTFHEVKDTDNKEDCLKEAMRVLKNKGSFVFLDLFDNPSYYPVHDKYREVISECKGTICEDELISNLLPLPFPLNGKRSLKYARIITGKKELPDE